MKGSKVYTKKDSVSEVYPEYYIIKVNQFDKIAKDSLDEWVFFLKNEEIKDNFKAKGLAKAKEELDVLKLGKKERATYERYLENLRYEASTLGLERKLGKEEGIEEGEPGPKMSIKFS